jgi:gliding motility-associated-like protein
VKFIFLYTACFRCSRLLILGLFIIPFQLLAQPQANFTMDKTGGCSPLLINFTNTTTGASANAAWRWDFDNGNISVLKNPGAIFNEERTYTITLTVTDGSQTSIQTKSITVYKKPTVDFIVLPATGCLPLQTVFSSSSSPGDGIIAGYNWDFGDGVTQQLTNPAVSHLYNFLQTATVSLTAVNSYGCSNTITKPNIITVHPPLQVSFSANKTVACDAPAAIQFYNNSTGPGTLTYSWDFGDGNFSTATTPLHTYNQRGVYTVKLTVTSSLGCTAVFTRLAYINIGDFTTDLQGQALICSNGSATFNNISTPAPVQSTWIFDGADTYTTYGNNSANYSFGIPGMHTVQLTNDFGTCQQTIIRQIEVKPKPELSGFLAEITGFCGAPVQVNFKDTTQTAVSWSWNFDWPLNYPGSSSNQQSPSHTYAADGSYQVALTVTNAEGCSAFIKKETGISKPLVGIFLDTASRAEGCDHLTVKFKPRMTEPIIQYQWDFGDGGTSTDPEPIHVYTMEGTYTVTLSYTTINGCTGTVTYNSIKIHSKPLANFTVQPTLCGNTPVLFTITTTGYATSYIWNFGDFTGNQTLSYPLHQYNNAGEYNVTLIAYNGMCNDTITKPAIIKVLPPFPKISSALSTCDGTRGLVVFTESSVQAASWHWDFGDATTASYAVFQSTIPHAYTATGRYKVILTTTNGACAVKDSVYVYVLLKQNPVLTANTSSICAGDVLNIQVSGLERPVLPPGYNTPYNYLPFRYSDGSVFNGTTAGVNVNNIPWTATLSNFPYGSFQLRTIVQSNYFGCKDTTNFIPVNVKGPSAAVAVVADNVCFKNSVVLRDISTIRNGVQIIRCDWSFGDNQTMTSATGAEVSHHYSNPGDYTVTLKVTDQDGCTASISRMVKVTGPKVSFNASGTNVPLNTVVSFINTTNNYNSPATTWQWTFGDGGASTGFSPSHTYTAAGTYIVTLIAQFPQSSCADTATKTIIVREFNSGFSTNASFIGDYGLCPPVLARFANTSTNYVRLVWDFGDGFTLENQNAPGHIYNAAGDYIITLTVYGSNGLVSAYRDTLHVGQPSAVINTDNLKACIGQEVVLNAPVHKNTVSYLWDFGNGTTQNTTDSFAVHQYMAAGNYTASLIVKDNNGCPTSAILPRQIIIHPDPVISIIPATAVVCKNDPVQLQATGAVSYSWSPAAGLNDPAIASPLATPINTTVYTVNATDNNGCRGQALVSVTVPKPFAMTAPRNFDICKGNTAQLNAAGADSYQWINNTTGLSNTQIANPTAVTNINTVYTIVGYDIYRCYTDTVNINVMVRPLPVVNTGPDLEVVYGSENRLLAAVSNDVIRWNWSPSDYLDCTNCQAPVSRPYSDMEYVLAVYTNYNCMAKDSVKLHVLCDDTKIFIPNAFTPNNDGRNDVFLINGQGVRIIKSLRIYNRWGEMILGKKNFYPNDNASAWNGRFKGLDAPAGVYVYFAEMECEAGRVFMRKGTVTLVR